MHFVYIIKSDKDESYYTGSTAEIESRLTDHNQGKVKYTKSKRPWCLVWYGAFSSKEKALAFEKYLKHGSGHALARKRLI